MSAPEPSPRDARPRDGLDLRELFADVWRERRTVLAVTLGAALLTLGITFLIPKWYRATAVILPPQEADLISNMARAQRALTRFPAFGILSDYFTPADTYKAILLSRSAQEDVVERFDLRSVYRKTSMEKTIKELKTHYRVKLNPDGTIAVEVDDRRPQRAADMANAFLDALDRLNVQTRTAQAHRTRLFLEGRVSETDSLLKASEAALEAYSAERRAVAPTAVGSGDVQAAADLMARKMLLEVRLGMLRGYLREDNEQVIQARSELEQLGRRIEALPRLQTELTRLVRETKIYEQLYLLLTAELEQARIRETMDTPTVQVLDPAIPPERHVRPRKATLAAAAGVLAFLGAVFWVAWRSGARRDAEA